jgi:hypothetical protein
MERQHVMEVRYMEDDCLHVSYSYELYGLNEIEFIDGSIVFYDGKEGKEIPMRDVCGISICWR